VESLACACRSSTRFRRRSPSTIRLLNRTEATNRADASLCQSVAQALYLPPFFTADTVCEPTCSKDLSTWSDASRIVDKP